MPDSAYERIISALRDHGSRVTETGRGTASAQCPAHEDRSPSLSVTASSERVLMHCHRECAIEDVLAELQMTKADLYDERPTYKRPVVYRYDDGRIVKRWYDAEGRKRFAQENAGPTATLFHLAELEKAPLHRYVFLCEGEADVAAIEHEGGVATTAPQGAGSFAKVDVSPLAGRLVTCIVDRDASGDKWAAQVAYALEGVADRYRFVRAKAGKDASDHFAAGHGLTDFEPYNPPLADDAVPSDLEPVRMLRFSAASDMGISRVRWLHGHEQGGHIPLGAITLLAGREGIGKSTITYDFISKVTNGLLPGEFYGAPKGVVIYATEDDWEPVILPRLFAAEADTSKVFRVDAYEGDEKDWIRFPRDLVQLTRMCREHDVALVVLDPIMSIIDGKLDTHKDREVREVLDPLARFAATAEVSVVGLIHVNKSGTSDPLNSIMGSRAFSAVARSVLYCIAMQRPEGDEGPEEFLFSQEKCNLGPKQGSQRYRIETVPLAAGTTDDPFTVYTSRVDWGTPDDRRAADVMEEAGRVSRPKGSLRQDILAWLKDKGDLMPIRDIIDAFSARAKAGTVNVTLSRMVDAQEIERPVNGMYRAT
jgi:hypothetical protein